MAGERDAGIVDYAFLQRRSYEPGEPSSHTPCNGCSKTVEQYLRIGCVQLTANRSLCKALRDNEKFKRHINEIAKAQASSSVLDITPADAMAKVAADAVGEYPNAQRQAGNIELNTMD